MLDVYPSYCLLHTVTLPTLSLLPAPYRSPVPGLTVVAYRSGPSYPGPVSPSTKLHSERRTRPSPPKTGALAEQKRRIVVIYLEVRNNAVLAATHNCDFPTVIPAHEPNAGAPHPNANQFSHQLAKA